MTLNGGRGRPETETDILVPSLSSTLLRRPVLLVLEDVRLLLESTLRLDCQLGRHVCGC